MTIYRSHLRPDREYLGFYSLPLLESSSERRQRKETRRRVLAFIAGAATMCAALAVTVILL